MAQRNINMRAALAGPRQYGIEPPRTFAPRPSRPKPRTKAKPKDEMPVTKAVGKKLIQPGPQVPKRRAYNDEILDRARRGLFERPDR